ncbi:MAG: hypothetical protein ACR2NM_17090, partial [Bythopirellula sp.]
MVGVLAILAGCAPFVAVIVGYLVPDETIEYWLVPIFSLLGIAVGLAFLSISYEKIGPQKGPKKNRPKVSPLVAFLLGCVFALAGLFCLTDAATNFEDMKNAPKYVRVLEDYEDDRDSRTGVGYSLIGGFAMGIQAYMGMLFVSIGVGIAAPQATGGFGLRYRHVLRGVAAVLAITWHLVGIATCYCYCTLAPIIESWPFLVVTVYEWLGLIPLALSIP